VEGRGCFTEASLDLVGVLGGNEKRGGLTAQHVIVGVICHCVYMRWGLRAALSLVGGHHRSRVDREPFVGVDGDTEEA
jgi:hypothetical protein